MAESESKRPLLADLRDELRALGGDLRESLVLRWQLALLELRADLRSGVRLGISLAVATTMVLSALPLLLVWLTAQLDGYLGLAQNTWLLIFGLALLTLGLSAGYLAWRRFRRRFLGLEQTLEELREDALWLREWNNER
jgi:LPXTG-motif cell wall-anchored protein